MGESMVKRLFLAGPYDLRAVEEFLEEQAAQGLMFVKQKGIFYYFEKCEPKKVRFAVDVFEKASVFDVNPAEETMEYIEYCEKCGWKFLFSNAKIQFFYSEEENPVDIQTDDEQKLKIIHKNVLLTNGGYWFSLLFLIFTQVSLFLFRQFTGASMVDQFVIFGVNWPLAVGFTGIIFYVIMDVIRYVRFYRKNKKRIENGLKLQYIEKKKVEKYHKISNSIIVIFSIFFLLSLGKMGSYGYLIGGGILVTEVLMCFLSYKMKGPNTTRQGSIAITIVVTVAAIIICEIGVIVAIVVWSFGSNSENVEYYDKEEKCYVTMSISHDEIPFTMEELGIQTEGIAYNDTTADCYTSMFAEYDVYTQTYFDKDLQEMKPYLTYEVLDSKWDELLNSYVDDFLNSKEFQCSDITKEEGDLWGAEKIYSLWSEEEQMEGRILVYNEKVIYISGGELEFGEDSILFMKESMKIS